MSHETSCQITPRLEGMGHLRDTTSLVTARPSPRPSARIHPAVSISCLAALLGVLVGAPSLSAQTAPPSYEEWIRSFRGLTVHERAFTADPDGDRIPNGGEFLHELDPTQAGSLDRNWANAPTLGYENGTLQFSYRLGSAVARNEISHVVFESKDLSSWARAVPEVGRDGRHVIDLDPSHSPKRFFNLNYHHNPSAPSFPVATFSARSEEDLGNFDPTPDGPWLLSKASSGAWRATRNDRWTNLRGGFGKAAANFLVNGDQVPVAILFSAETYVQPSDKRLFVRLIVDGKPMDPADVVFTQGNAPQIRAARAFEFTEKFDRGLHTVEAQWMVDSGGEGYIRDAALLIRQGDVDDSRASLKTVTPASGLNIETKSTVWQNVPDLSTTVTAEERDTITVTVSAEAYAAGGESLLLRVLIDGAVAEPGEVRFASDGFEGTHCMAFGTGDLAGSQEVQVQYRSESGGTVGLGDRTLTVSVADNANSSPLRQWFRSAEKPVNAPKVFGVVPDMTAFTLLPSDSDVSVIFTAEFLDPNPGMTHARLTIGGAPVPGSEILLTDGDSHTGVHSFTFDAKHVNAGALASASSVAVEWMTESGQQIRIGKRSMILYVKQHSVPDLAEGPAFGGGYDIGNGPQNFPVEPMRGKKHLLVILMNPKGIDDPVPPRVNVPGGLTGNGEPIPSISDLDEAFFGANDSVADYFDKVSGGRMTLENAGVMGPYETDLDWDYYYNGPGGHQDIWIEAVTKAEIDGFNYSDYDFDGDGYISPFNELAIVIVKPQVAAAGFVRQLWKGRTAEERDGVYIDVITEWYTSDPIADYALVIHELGHQILGLADLYSKTTGSSVGTRPGVYALMDMGGTKWATHINPAYKIALGWTTPWILTEGTDIALEDIKVSHEAVVLPRTPSVTGDEYIVVETRPQPANNVRYDFGIMDSGLGVWHIIESNLDNINPPPCNNVALWNSQTGGENPRGGIRLVRPGVSYNEFSALWDASQYDLDEFGMTCPPQTPHNVLLWSDGSPSYELRNFSPPGALMTFDVIAP